MSSFLGQANSFLGIITVLALLVGAVAYLIRSYKYGGNDFDKQAVTNLQAAVAGLETRNQLLTEENNRLRAELKEQVQLQADMGGQMKILQALAQGQPAIDGFAKTFEQVVEEFRVDIREFKKGQDRIIKLLEKP